jgi:hypothetical protein
MRALTTQYDHQQQFYGSALEGPPAGKQLRRK